MLDAPDLTLKTPDVVAIEFGALAPRLFDQLQAFVGVGVSPTIPWEQVATWQRTADAITLCRVQGVITTEAARVARRHIMRRVVRACRLVLEAQERDQKARRRRLSARLDREATS